MVDPLIGAALISALSGAATSFFGGSNKIKKVPTQTKAQTGLQSNLINQANQLSGMGGGYQNALQYLQSLLDPNSQAQQNFAAPYLQNFNERILPDIAERFAGAGALSSSGFGQALGGAGANLQAQLASLQSGLQQQGAGTLLNQYNQLTSQALGNPQFANVEYDKGTNAGQSALKAASPYLPFLSQYLFNQQSKSPSPYQAQYPLTNMYDTIFRQQGLPQ